MRFSCRLALTAILIIALLGVLTPAVFGQKSVDQNEPVSFDSTSAAGTLNQPNPLPDDFPTREKFDPTGNTTQTVGPSAGEYFRVLFGLFVVLGVIWGLSVLMKRFVVARGLAGSSENLKVLYAQSLSPSRTLYLVRLVDRVLLIGSGEGGLRTLAEITDPAEVNSILKELEFKGNFESNPFREKLKTLVGTENGDSDTQDFDVSQRKMKGTLEKLKNINISRRE
jgi:flagellar biogenesis protein FliO